MTINKYSPQVPLLQNNPWEHWQDCEQNIPVVFATGHLEIQKL
jgi:hypothetical protein